MGSCRGKPGPQEPSHVGPECQEFRPFLSYLLGGRTPHPNPEAAPSELSARCLRLGLCTRGYCQA